MSCRPPPEHGPSGGAPTARQLEVLAAVYRYRQRYDRAPTARELSEAFGWSGPSAAFAYYDRLEGKGLITREPGLARTVSLTQLGKTFAEAWLRQHPEAGGTKGEES
jgi:Mn-dependent DtxR family transcriptional regulator